MKEGKSKRDMKACACKETAMLHSIEFASLYVRKWYENGDEILIKNLFHITHII